MKSTKIKRYLSVDLDFWNEREDTECYAFLSKLKSLFKIHIVDSHEKLLPHINVRKYDEVINLDRHADIANNGNSLGCKKFKDGRKVPELNCGTWANWIKNRETFTWLYPYETDENGGYCHEPRINKFSPFVHPKIAAWKNVRKVAVRDIPSNILEDVVAVGVACSYDWVDAPSIISVAKKVFGKLPKEDNHFRF